MKNNADLTVIPTVPVHTIVQRRTILGAAVAALAAPLASAQTAGLDMTQPITAFGTAMGATIATNAPSLFTILALAVGFYFLWGRVRSLF